MKTRRKRLNFSRLWVSRPLTKCSSWSLLFARQSKCSSSLFILRWSPKLCMKISGDSPRLTYSRSFAMVRLVRVSLFWCVLILNYMTGTCGIKCESVASSTQKILRLMTNLLCANISRKSQLIFLMMTEKNTNLLQSNNLRTKAQCWSNRMRFRSRSNKMNQSKLRKCSSMSNLWMTLRKLRQKTKRTRLSLTRKLYLTSNLFLQKKWLLWTSSLVFKRDGTFFLTRSLITKKVMAVKKLKASVRNNEIIFYDIYSLSQRFRTCMLNECW